MEPRHLRNESIFTDEEQEQVRRKHAPRSLATCVRELTLPPPPSHLHGSSGGGYQLCSRFSLSDGELRTVLEALSYVFEQVRQLKQRRQLLGSCGALEWRAAGAVHAHAASAAAPGRLTIRPCSPPGGVPYDPARGAARAAGAKRRRPEKWEQGCQIHARAKYLAGLGRA